MLLLWFEQGKEMISQILLGNCTICRILLTDAIIPWEQWVKQLNADIIELDPEISDIIEHEKNRQ
jgi:hypothetical protein